MKRTHSGAASGKGAKYEWDGNKEIGIGRQAHKHLGAFRGITYFLRSKSLELVVSQQHDEDVPAYNHAGGRLVGKLRIKPETEFGKELDRFVEILYRQIHKNLGSPVFSFDLSVLVCLSSIAYFSVMAFRLERPASHSLPIMRPC